MIDKVASRQAMIKGAGCATLLAGLLLGPMQLHAATQNTRTMVELKARPGEINDLSVLAKNRPKKCIAEDESEPGGRGWRKSTAQCSWQNRLKMRRWEVDKGSDSKSCLSKQALWWAWARPRVAATADPLVWNSAWPIQSLVDDSGAKKRVGIIERTANGSWMATEWTWAPSPRAATRKWQEGRWKLLTEVAKRLRQSQPTELVSQETALLRMTWEKNLKGSAAEVSAGSWLWERDGLCMRMETVGISQAQLHLPYSKADGRLEQRAAMQLRLARTYPNATWIIRFRLLPLPDSAAHSGAKYEAIWIENATVRGQLWMPSKVDGTVLRAKIAVALPTKNGSDADAAAVEAIALSIDRELIGLATIWAVDNEQ